MTTYEVAAIKACQRAGSQITECEDGPKCDGCLRDGTRMERLRGRIVQLASETDRRQLWVCDLQNQ